MGLVLHRNTLESIVVRDEETNKEVMTITVIEAKPDNVRLHFEAKPNYKILRSELIGSCNAPKEKP